MRQMAHLTQRCPPVSPPAEWQAGVLSAQNRVVNHLAGLRNASQHFAFIILQPPQPAVTTTLLRPPYRHPPAFSIQPRFVIAFRQRLSIRRQIHSQPPKCPPNTTPLSRAIVPAATAEEPLRTRFNMWVEDLFFINERCDIPAGLEGASL